MYVAHAAIILHDDRGRIFVDLAKGDVYFTFLEGVPSASALQQFTNIQIASNEMSYVVN